MDQKGYIIDIIDDDIATFKMERLSACASCGKCIGSKNPESKEIIVEVENKIGAKAGQYVEVSMEQIDVMKAIFIMYGIPLVALIIGSVGSFYLLGSIGMDGKKLELISFFVGLVFTGIAYLYIKTKDKSYRERRKYMPTVTRVLIDLNMESLNKKTEE